MWLLLENPKAEWNHPVHTSLGPDRNFVRTERWRYTSYEDGEELYGHDNDSNEWHNLADNPKYVETKDRLRAMLPANPSRRKLKHIGDLSKD